MIRALLTVSVCGLLASPLTGSITVATWNLHNFLVSNRFEEGQFLYKYPMPENRKRQVRELIRRTSPDVLFLQEVGDRRFLNELQLDLASIGIDFPFSGFSAIPGARTGLAVLSRLPLKELIFHDPGQMGEIPFSLRRGIQEVVIVHEELTLRVFHVHLKSRYSDDPSDPDSRKFRTAEMHLLRGFLQRYLGTIKDQAILLAGDFNTPFQSPIIDPLHASWHPVQVNDSAGSGVTYFHHSGRSEIIDGFWIPANSTRKIQPVGIFPEQPPFPSDHRLLVVRVFYPD